MTRHSRSSPGTQLADNARHHAQVQTFISVCGPDHPRYHDYLAQLRTYRADRLALFAALAAEHATPIPDNIPFTYRRPA